MSKYSFILLVLFLAITANNLRAQVTTSWTGGGGDPNAHNPLNWSNGVPTELDTARFNLLGSNGLNLGALGGDSPLEVDRALFSHGSWAMYSGELICHRSDSMPGGSRSFNIGPGTFETATVSILGSSQGSKLTTRGVMDIGSGLNSRGTLVVSHESKVVHDPLPGTSGWLAIGFRGEGFLTIQAGGSVTSTRSAFLGDGFDGGGGQLWVMGPNLATGTSSTFQSSALFVGHRTYGGLHVLEGGKVIVDGFFSAASKQFGADVGYAQIEVDGVGSTLSLAQNGSDSRFGEVGDATMDIRNGGQVQTGGWAHLGYQATGTATVTVSGDGSKLHCMRPLNAGDGLAIGGQGDATLIVVDGGDVEVSSWVRMAYGNNSTSTLALSGSGSVLSAYGLYADFSPAGGSSTALVEINSGALLDVATDVIVGGGGRMKFDLGTLQADTALIKDGAEVTGRGTINALVENNGTVSLGMPKGALSLSSSFSQTESGILDVTLDGVEAGIDYSQLLVSGALVLGGTLNIKLNEGYTPSLGDLFDIATAGSVVGQFDTIKVPEASEYSFNVVYLEDRVQLQVGEKSLVRWTNGIPIQGAAIEAYYLAGSKNSPEVRVIPPVTEGIFVESAADGSFGIPPEFYIAELLPDEIPPAQRYRGVRARIDYQEETGLPFPEQERSIRNYPDWNPFRPLDDQTTSSVVITFPHPVFFVPGVLGKVNAGVNSSDVRLGAFLTLDSGAKQSDLAAIALGDSGLLSEVSNWLKFKHGLSGFQKVPAFIYFGMPSKSSSLGDGVPWGYDNDPSQSANSISTSSDAITTHLLSRVMPQLESLSPGRASDIPVDILAHSLGGLIARNWIVEKGNESLLPKLGRFVTYDSPHGGVQTANFAPLLGGVNLFYSLVFGSIFYSESLMNGTSIIADSPPTGEFAGWNYSRMLPFDQSRERLTFSSPDNYLIVPDETAHGVGRIMTPLFPFLANGYCERFFGGYALAVDDAGHSIQQDIRVLISTSRFLATGEPPFLGTVGFPGLDLIEAQLQDSKGNQCPNESFLAQAQSGMGAQQTTTYDRFHAEVPAGTSTGEFASFTNADPILITALLSTIGADVDVLDEFGVSLPRIDEHRIPFGDGEILSYEVASTQSAISISTVAGSTDLSATVSVAYLDGIGLEIERPSGALNVGDDVNLSMFLRDQNTAIVEGPIGAASFSELTKPDGSSLSFDIQDSGLNGDLVAGDHIINLTLAGLDEPGRYQITSRMLVAGVPSSFIIRGADHFFILNEDSASLGNITDQRLVDLDGNRLADYLALEIAVNAPNNGEFQIQADLVDGGGNSVELSSTFVVASAPEIATATLVVEPDFIFSIPAGANLALENIRLIDNEHVLLLDTIPSYAVDTLNSGDFDLPPDPVISNCIPSFGSTTGGDLISITGQNFGEVEGVYFGSNLSPSFSVVSSNTIEAELPTWDGVHDLVDIRILDPDGQGTLVSGFQYQTRIVRPASFSLSEAKVTSGSISSVYDSDNDELIINARNNGSCTFHFKTALIAPKQMELELEISASDEKRTAWIYTRNWSASTWDEIAKVKLSGVNQLVTLGELDSSAYIRSADGQALVQIRFIPQAIGSTNSPFTPKFGPGSLDTLKGPAGKAAPNPSSILGITPTPPGGTSAQFELGLDRIQFLMTP